MASVLKINNLTGMNQEVDLFNQRSGSIGSCGSVPVKVNASQ
jgi:hypothetical protein